MKAFIFFTALFTVFSSCQSDDDTPAKKEELKKILTDYFNALTNKDTIALRSLTTDNFVLFDEGAVYDNASAVKAMAKRKPFKVTFSFDSLNIHMDKKNASAYYFRKAQFTFDDTIHMPATFLESATFNKEGDKWKLRFLQSSYRVNGQ
jgi:ketosteroid isomerase-like protein